MINCTQCNKLFYKKPSNIKKSDVHFCSQVCHHRYKKEKFGYGNIIEVECKWCSVKFYRKERLANRQQVHLCSYTCSSSYKETLIKRGYKRSKFELYTEDRLISEYPFLSLKFNDKKVIGKELDIYIETINTAIEINGPYHYKPLKGFKALNRTIRNDIQKLCACVRAGIQLHSIDISLMRRSNETYFDQYYQHIKNIIETAPTYANIDKTCNKQIKRTEPLLLKKYCNVCNNINTTHGKFCSSECKITYRAERSPLGKIPVNDIISKFNELGNNYTKTGKFFGVSDSAIRKKIKHFI